MWNRKYHHAFSLKDFFEGKSLLEVALHLVIQSTSFKSVFMSMIGFLIKDILVEPMKSAFVLFFRAQKACHLEEKLVGLWNEFPYEHRYWLKFVLTFVVSFFFFSSFLPQCFVALSLSSIVHRTPKVKRVHRVKQDCVIWFPKLLLLLSLFL
jgi:Na+/alanine symporter